MGQVPGVSSPREGFVQALSVLLVGVVDPSSPLCPGLIRLSLLGNAAFPFSSVLPGYLFVWF